MPAHLPDSLPPQIPSALHSALLHAGVCQLNRPPGARSAVACRWCSGIAAGSRHRCDALKLAVDAGMPYLISFPLGLLLRPVRQLSSFNLLRFSSQQLAQLDQGEVRDTSLDGNAPWGDANLLLFHLAGTGDGEIGQSHWLVSSC